MRTVFFVQLVVANCLNIHNSYTDQGFIQEFSTGGGGVPASLTSQILYLFT